MIHLKGIIKGLIVLAILYITPGFAERLTLDKAEAIALEKNIRLQIAEESMNQANAAFREALGELLPGVSAYGQYTENFELPVVVIDIPGAGPQSIKMGSPYSSTAGFSLSQPLFTSGALYASVSMAKKGKEIAEIQSVQEKNSVISTVRTLYNQILLVESLIEATEESRKSAKANLDIVAKKKVLGQASQFEVLQADVKYREIGPKLVSLKNQRQTLMTNLKTFLNLKEDKEFELSGQLIPDSNPFRDYSLEEIKEEAMQNRPELTLLQQQKAILKSQRLLAASAALPKVNLQADVTHQAQAETRDDLEYYRSKNVAVSVSIPLFKGGKNLASVQQANIELKKHELEYEQAEDHILSEVENAYLMIFETAKSVESNTALVRQAQEAVRLAKIMYENGRATQVELLSAESGLLNAKSAYLSSVFEYNTAILQLKKAINKL